MTTAIARPGCTWSTWHDLPAVVAAPANLKRSVTIALVIGTLFVAMNQLGVILSGEATLIVWLKVPHHRRTEVMPFINVKLIEGVFTPDQKSEIVRRLNDTMVEIEGENMRSVTWCVIEEVASGDWGIAGQPLTTEDVKALARGVSVA